MAISPIYETHVCVLEGQKVSQHTTYTYSSMIIDSLFTRGNWGNLNTHQMMSVEKYATNILFNHKDKWNNEIYIKFYWSGIHHISFLKRHM